MNKSSLSILAKAISSRRGLNQTEAERFISRMFDVANEGLQEDKLLKVKWLGTFKVTSVKDRESIDVNTGERIVIEGRDKISFTPDNILKEIINKPFAQFETVVVNDGVDFSDIDEKFAREELEETSSHEETEQHESPAEEKDEQLVEQKPAVVQPAPVAEQPAPFAEQSAPVVEQSEPVAEQPQKQVEVPAVEPEQEQVEEPVTPAFEREPEQNDPEEKSTPMVEHQPEAAEQKVEPVVVQNVESVVVQKAETVAVPKTDSAAEQKTELVAEQRAESVAEQRAKSVAEQKTESAAERKAESVAEQQQPVPVVEPQAEPHQPEQTAVQNQQPASAPVVPQSADDFESDKHHFMIPKYIVALACLVFVLLLGGMSWFAFNYGKMQAQRDHLASQLDGMKTAHKPNPVVKKAVSQPVDTTKVTLQQKAKEDSIRMVASSQAVKMAEQAEQKQSQKQDQEQSQNLQKDKKALDKKAVDKKLAEKQNNTETAVSRKQGQYDNDPRVRTGAYRIVGVSQTITVKSGQTLAGISKTYLGPGMECYLEALNGSGEFKAGQKVKIPKLELKRKAKN